jgi:hypothetical protein
MQAYRNACMRADKVGRETGIQAARHIYMQAYRNACMRADKVGRQTGIQAFVLIGR